MLLVVLGVLLFSGLFFLLVQLLQGRSEVNLVASAACFVFAGLGILVGGLSVRSGEVVSVDGSVSSVVFSYSVVSSDLAGVLGLVFLLFGFFLVGCLLFVPRVESDEFSIGEGL